LENDKIKVTVSCKGAAVTEVLLKNYKTWDKKPLRLFQEENNQFAYVFIAGSKEWNSSALSFTADRESLQVKGADSSSITYHTRQ
jgi:YidC/Oxa1 family membrane protein insertase